MHKLFKIKAYEMENGPHFDERHAQKAVSKMKNEDGTVGPHWSMEETTALANQYGVKFTGGYNRCDWFVALNMVYSDYYKVIMNIANSVNPKHFVEFAKAWLEDKDIDEGKMWYYYVYIMCDKVREEEQEMFERYGDEDDEEEERPMMHSRRMGRMVASSRDYEDYDDDDEDYSYRKKSKSMGYEIRPEYGRIRSTRYYRY